MDFRPAADDEQASKVNADINRPSQYLRPTTDDPAHQPGDSYQIGATHGQRRKHQDVLCE